MNRTQHRARHEKANHRREAYLPTGVTLNAHGDLDAFLSSTFTNVAILCAIVAFFMKLRVHYPLVYSGNVVNGSAPSMPNISKHLSWIPAACGSTLQQNID